MILGNASIRMTVNSILMSILGRKGVIYMTPSTIHGLEIAVDYLSQTEYVTLQRKSNSIPYLQTRDQHNIEMTYTAVRRRHFLWNL